VAERTADLEHANDGPDALMSSDEEKSLIKVPVDDTTVPPASASDSKYLFDSDGSEDMSSSQPLPDSKDHIMLLDTEDEASSHQVPCLIPESIKKTSCNSPSHNDSQHTVSTSSTLSDGNIDVCHASSVPVDADIPNGSIQKAVVGSQPFDFVNDVMKSCSPKLSNK